MKHLILRTAFLLGVAPLFSPLALAHGDLRPNHGGRIIEVQSQLLELVISAGVVDLYLTDHHNQPQAVDGAEGKATLLVDGRKIDVALKPGGGNRLTGTGPVPAIAPGTAPGPAIISVRVEGKTLTGRFGTSH